MIFTLPALDRNACSTGPRTRERTGNVLWEAPVMTFFCHVFCARTLPSFCAFHKVPTHYVVTSHAPWYELSLARSCLPRDVHSYPTGFPRPYILSCVWLRVLFCVLPTDVYPSPFNVLHAFPCTVTLSPLQSKIYCACLRQSTSTRKRNL